MLSADSTLSCASCHVEHFAFAEPFTVSHGIGLKARRRNTPSVLNSAYQSLLGWGGDWTTLEAQAQSTFVVEGDMGLTVTEVMRRLRASTRYRAEFRRVFGRPPRDRDVWAAIAAYERRLAAKSRSRFDHFLVGGVTDSLTVAERRGWALFTSPRFGCAGCHEVVEPSAWNAGVAALTDNRPHNLGVGYDMGVMADPGRYEVTKDPEDWGAFITPSLRMVRHTAPYMHDGSLHTLDAVLEFYNRGGNKNPNLDVVMRPRTWTSDERADLIAFLLAL